MLQPIEERLESLSKRCVELERENEELLDGIDVLNRVCHRHERLLDSLLSQIEEFVKP